MYVTPRRSRSVLVVAAHPDDELLGVGGTIRRHALAGDTVNSLLICEGTSVRYGDGDGPLERHSEEAAEALGVSSLEMLGFPDQRLDTMSLVDIISPIEEHVRRHEADLVYTHFGGDLNRDHRLVFDAVLVACRPFAASVEAIYCFETPSSTEWSAPSTFQPDYFVDISATLDAKLEAFQCYESEVRDYPHPRSFDHLRYRAHYWGNLVGMDAAEAFVTRRRLWR